MALGLFLCLQIEIELDILDVENVVILQMIVKIKAHLAQTR